MIQRHEFSTSESRGLGERFVVQSEPFRTAGFRGAGFHGTGFREFGSLSSLVANPLVTDVFVNGSAGVWVDRGEGLEVCAGFAFDEHEVRNLAVRLMSLGGRHIDEATPCVDARLHSGIRVHAVLPPISPTGTLLSIRIPRSTGFSLAEMDAAGFFADGDLGRVGLLVAKRKNVLITGASGSGKTTLLAALLATASATERIVAVEDVAELWVRHPHFVSLEARQANLEGVGEISLAKLVREALRMRPDRLVLGECRGAEVRELLSALNTGHDGGGGTLHANTLADVPARLEALGALAGMSEVAIARQTVSAIDAVLHLERTATGRRLSELGAFVIDRRGRLAIGPVPVVSPLLGLAT
jgi:pilus assembly protein CpaF